LIGWGWKKIRISQRLKRIGAGLFIVLAVAGFTAMIFSTAPDHDEVEHASAVWQMSQGLLPYQDFFQHHSPMLWVLLSPLFKIPFVTHHPVESMRMVSAVAGLIVLLILFRMTNALWKEKQAAWISVLFLIGYFLYLELNNLRPDLIANVCNLMAFSILVRRRSMVAYGLSGILLGFTFSLSPKYLPLVLLLPVFMIVYHRKWLFHIRALFIHGLGIVIGLSPLFIWLARHHLVESFNTWVIGFNASPLHAGVGGWGGKFQVLPAAFALWGCYRLIKSRNEEESVQGRWLSVILIFSALVYLRPWAFHNVYYEQTFILCAAWAASGPFGALIKKWAGSGRTVPACLLMGAVLWPVIHQTQSGLRYKEYAKGMEMIHTLRAIAGDDAVICIPPDHPITSRNAVYIGTGWQYHAWLSNPLCRDKLKDVVREIEERKPAIILQMPAWYIEHGFTAHLESRGILSRAEAGMLQDYIESHYRLIGIQNREFWIRNDRYEKFFDSEGKP
jgi:hypothetical protein